MVVVVKRSTVKHQNMTTQPPNSTPTGYTTIPISFADVISRSLQNLISTVSRHRPWPELISSAGVLNRPDSLSAALTRLRLNSNYFQINYSLIVAVCAALSLLGSPFSLLIFGLVFALWLLIHFFREDPLVIWGYHVSDRLVLVGLGLISVLAVFWSGGFGNLDLVVVIGCLVCGVHAVLRKSDGLALHEQEALIGSSSVPVSSYGAI